MAHVMPQDPQHCFRHALAEQSLGTHRGLLHLSRGELVLVLPLVSPPGEFVVTAAFPPRCALPLNSRCAPSRSSPMIPNAILN